MMFHEKRRWNVGTVASAEVLAEKLTNHTWTLCTAFTVAGHEDYLFLNDSLSEDGAGEWAVVKRLAPEQYKQVESITFSWCDAPKALEYIRASLAGEYDDSRGRVVRPQLDMSANHRCHACA